MHYNNYIKYVYPRKNLETLFFNKLQLDKILLTMYYLKTTQEKFPLNSVYKHDPL